ncbi:cupin domain-containing protein [Mesorhizobium sp. M0119]|uniref:cupin domain-containing protein n=1 Tax=unclassified Mesorhizobium TaxID=325217 RepID=UPI0033376D27
MAGRAEMWIDEEHVVLTAGQSLVVAAHRQHGFRNVGSQYASYPCRARVTSFRGDVQRIPRHGETLASSEFVKPRLSLKTRLAKPISIDLCFRHDRSRDFSGTGRSNASRRL